MNPAHNPVVPVIIVAAATAWLLTRAQTADRRSHRIGGRAAACGVAAFAPALIGPAFEAPTAKQGLVACALLTLAQAAGAVLLAVWALRVRRRDGGAAARPVVGLLCGLVNLFCGAGLLNVERATPLGGMERTWRSVKHGFEVTVPSELWVQKENRHILAEFTCQRPFLIGMVADARPAGTDAEYAAALAYARGVRADTPTAETVARDGPNPHGLPHWLYAGRAMSKNVPYYFGMSVTRVRGKAVILMVEGQYRLTSEVGQEHEAAALRAQADQFLSSVR